MTRDEFNLFCQSLKAANHVVQWGGADVWKIGGKIFAIAPRMEEGEFQKISFKVSDFAYEILSQQDGIIPAPYLARAKWVQVQSPEGMDDETLQNHIADAYDIISKKLTRKVRTELGLN